MTTAQAAIAEVALPAPKRTRKKKAADPAVAAEQAQQLSAALEKAERLAESEIEIAELFLLKQRPEIARRRLEHLLELYPQSQAANTARKMLRSGCC